MTGRVKWFNDKLGYGFIHTHSGTDVYVHYTQIQMEGFKTLRPDQRVEFDVYDGPKGHEAKNVRMEE